MRFFRSTLCPGMICLLLLSAEANAARFLTLHPDGARVEQSETAKNGYLEVVIPPAAHDGSLRIYPGKGVEILRVVTLPLKPAKSVEKELAQLAEREELLNDRLTALKVREDIFKAAAKSQSGKAPRRTKTNPEPLSGIKQGTDYAIAQLESVYQARRRAEKELTRIGERRGRLGKDQQTGGTVARVWLTPASGSATAVWSQAGRSWSPVYQVRVDDHGNALLSLMAKDVSLARAEKAELALAPLLVADSQARFKYVDEWSTLMKESFRITKQSDAASPSVAIGFVNTSALNLPAGDVSCFRNGAYMGKGRFQGAEAGKSLEIVCGGSGN